MINFSLTILKKKVLREVSFVYVGALINGISLFLINIFLGRILEKDLFGIFTLSIMVLSTVAEMSDFGLNGGLLRFAPYYLARGEESKLKQLVKTIWQWRVWLAAILTFGGIILSPWLAQYVFNQPQISSYLMFAFLGVGGVVLAGFTSAYLQARQAFFISAIFQSLKGMGRLLLIVLIFLIDVRDVYSYLFIYISVPWILFLFSYRYLPADFYKVKIEPEIKAKIHSQLARFSFWLTIWSFSAIFASRVDQIMLSQLLGLENVAVYAMAFQFVFIYALALQSISAVLLPKASALKTIQELRDFFKKSLKWIIPAALILAGGIYFSQYIIHFIFGQKYSEAVPVYLFLSYSMLLSFVTIPTSLIITVFNKTQLVAYSGFLQLVINFLLNLVLIPRFGIMGAAYTFGLGLLVSVLYNLVCSMYLLRYKKIEVV